MSRLARVVIPGVAHHITQRGNGRQKTFFTADDYRRYLRLLRVACGVWDVRCAGYCLMPNHVHLILIPTSAVGLSRCLAWTHRAYAGFQNARRGTPGHFWQARFGSVAMDDVHLYQAFRYVLLNPVRAGLVPTATAWPWSNARACLSGRLDPLADPSPVATMIRDMTTYLAAAPDLTRVARIRAGETCGWPAAEPEALVAFEAQTGRRLRPLRRGPMPRAWRSVGLAESRGSMA